LRGRLADRGADPVERAVGPLEVGRDLDAAALTTRAHRSCPPRQSVQVSRMNGAGLAVHQHQVQHVQRVDGRTPSISERFAVAVQRLQREAACVHLAAFGDELGDLVVEVQVAGEGLVAQRGKAALHAQRHAGAVQQDRGLEALALQPRGLQQVDEADRAFEGDGVEGDERLLAGFGLDVGEDLLFVVDEELAFLVQRVGDSWAWWLLGGGWVRLAPFSRRRCATARARPAINCDQCRIGVPCDAMEQLRCGGVRGGRRGTSLHPRRAFTCNQCTRSMGGRTTMAQEGDAAPAAGTNPASIGARPIMQSTSPAQMPQRWRRRLGEQRQAGLPAAPRPDRRGRAGPRA
jgi:hypothetical protein